MQHEAKHSFFKHVSRIVRNFHNISRILAVKYQHYMCYQMLEPHTYLQHIVAVTQEVDVNVHDIL